MSQRRQKLFTPAFHVDKFGDDSFINKTMLRFSLAKREKIRYREKLQRAALLVMCSLCRTKKNRFTLNIILTGESKRMSSACLR